MSIERGVGRDLVFIMTDTSGYAASSISDISSQVSIDGAPFVYTTNLTSEITGDGKSKGYYKLTLTDAEMNGGTIALAITPSSTSYERQNIVIYPTTMSSQVHSVSGNIISHGDSNWRGGGSYSF